MSKRNPKIASATFYILIFFMGTVWGHHLSKRYDAFPISALASEVLPFIGEENQPISNIANNQAIPEQPVYKDSVKIPIIVYHSIRPYTPDESKIQDQFDITPELFEKHLEYLKKNGFTTLSFNQLADYFINKKPLPQKSVILNFDDGWENQYTYAFPLLKKYHDIGTFFIFTNAIGHKHYLTSEEIHELDASGMEIGSHTKSHPYLSKLSSLELKKEIFESKDILEHLLGKPVTAFASPFGYSNPEIISIIKEAGYTTGRTTVPGTYHTKDDLLQLKSILIGDNFTYFTNVLGSK